MLKNLINNSFWLVLLFLIACSSRNQFELSLKDPGQKESFYTQSKFNRIILCKTTNHEYQTVEFILAVKDDLNQLLNDRRGTMVNVFVDRISLCSKGVSTVPRGSNDVSLKFDVLGVNGKARELLKEMEETGAVDIVYVEEMKVYNSSEEAVRDLFKR